MRQVIITAESKAEKQWTYYIKLTISLQRIIPSTVEVQRDISEKKYSLTWYLHVLASRTPGPSVQHRLRSTRNASRSLNSVVPTSDAKLARSFPTARAAAYFWCAERTGRADVSSWIVVPVPPTHGATFCPHASLYNLALHLSSTNVASNYGSFCNFLMANICRHGSLLVVQNEHWHDDDVVDMVPSDDWKGRPSSGTVTASLSSSCFSMSA